MLGNLDSLALFWIRTNLQTPSHNGKINLPDVEENAQMYVFFFSLISEHFSAFNGSIENLLLVMHSLLLTRGTLGENNYCCSARTLNCILTIFYNYKCLIWNMCSTFLLVRNFFKFAAQ